MNRSLPTLLLLALPSPAAAQGEPAPALPDAAALLDRVAAATGSEVRRAALRSVRATGKVGITGVGEGSFTELHLGTRARYTVTMEGFGSMTQGTTGDMSWSTDPAVGITVKRGHDQGAVARLFAIGRLAPWRSIYATATTEEEVELDGRRHYRLRMQPERGDPDRWFVDPELAAVTRVDLSLPDPMGGELPCQLLFGDWKVVGGLRFAHSKVQKVGTYAIRFTYATIEPDAKIADADVAPTAEVLAAAEDAGKQTPQAPTRSGEFALETLAAQHAVSIRLRVDKDRIGPSLAVLLPEVMSHLTKAGVSPSGPPFSRYHSIADGVIDLEAGMPVAKEVAGSGRVQASQLPAGKAAVTWHIGPFETLERSYHALQQWIAGQGLSENGGFWEVYWTDPGIEPDSSKWRTQIVWPVK